MAACEVALRTGGARLEFSLKRGRPYTKLADTSDMQNSGLSAGVEPQPLFFSSAGRPLYGFYCPAVALRADPPAIVACHSIGLEHIVPTRMLAMVVRQAAAMGYPAMLYHSRGHGDSSGDFADVTLDGLVEDALNAAACVREQSGAKRVIFMGVRFGTVVAAAALSRHPDSAGLILWEPVHRGADYFRQFVRGLLFAAVARGEKLGQTADDILQRVERDGRADIHGTYLHAKFYMSSRDADLANTMQNWHGPTLLAQIQPRISMSPDNQHLSAALEARGAKVTAVRFTEEPGWQFWRIPWVSASLLEQTGAWLDALA
jgi:pimeloyl-ACP methyl ester carboxylesterase